MHVTGKATLTIYSNRYIITVIFIYVETLYKIMVEEMISRMGQSEKRMQDIKGQLHQLNENMKMATSQASKDEIRQRQDELRRQLEGMERR
jgi:hypothetical protein